MIPSQTNTLHLFCCSVEQGEPGDLGEKGAAGFPGPRGMQVGLFSLLLIWSLEPFTRSHISYFSLCCDQIPNEKQLSEGKVEFDLEYGPSCQGTQTGSRWDPDPADNEQEVGGTIKPQALPLMAHFL